MKHYLNISLLLLFIFGCIQSSEGEKNSKSESYKKYFEQQEKIYTELSEQGISVVRPLMMNEVLAEEVVSNSQNEVKTAISGIEQGIFCSNRKNMILHGKSGTGKTCLAQAIAIKAQTPCLFFNAVDISTEHIDSGVQSLKKIFQYAKKLEKNFDKPCIIIFNDLESFIRTNDDKNYPEYKILRKFLEELYNSGNSKVVVIGTINQTGDLPVKMTNEVAMIELSFPSLKQREAALSYYLNIKHQKYGIIYPKSVTASDLARQTKEFSYFDLQRIVDEGTMPAIRALALSNKNNNLVKGENFSAEIKRIKKQPWWNLERETGTWKHTLKMHFRDPRVVLPAAVLAATMTISYNIRKGFVIQEKQNE